MFSMQVVPSTDAKTFLNTKRDVEESLLVGDTTVIQDAEQVMATQNNEDKMEYIDIQSPVLSFNTRLDARDEIMANV